MEIKCIALDLDGTTLDRRGHLSPENRGALEYAIEKGVHVVIPSLARKKLRVIFPTLDLTRFAISTKTVSCVSVLRLPRAIYW